MLSESTGADFTAGIRLGGVVGGVGKRELSWDSV